MTGAPAYLRFLASYLPAIVLCLVATHHVYQTSVRDLPRWKGGGFGMFAGIDSQDTRFVRLYVTTDQGETVPVAVPPSYWARFERARLLPGDPATAALADDLLRRHWVWADRPSPGAGAPARLAALPPGSRIRLAEGRDLLAPARVNVRSLRLEILTLSHESASHRLSARLLRVVESYTGR